MTFKKLIILSAAFWLQGCSLLVPYDSEFNCPREGKFGKCTDVQGAYDEAVYGESSSEEGTQSKQEKVSHAKTVAVNETPRDRFREAQYRELAGLIEKPVTPVTVPPKELRTLIIGYPTDGTYWLPRYVYYFATEPRFVMGDYVNRKKDGPVLFPNGGR